MPSTIRLLSGLCIAAAMLFAATDAHAQIGATLVSAPAARQAQLEPMWSTMVRVDPTRGRVQSIRFHANLVFAQTSLGVVQAIDAETGHTYWTTEVGQPNMETMPPSSNDKYVAVTNGSTLYALARSNGAIAFAQRLGGAPSAGTAVNDVDAIVPLSGGIIEAYKLKRERLLDSIPIRYSGAGAPLVAPLVVGNRTMWSTPQGYIYSREISKSMDQFRFRMDDKVDAAPAYLSPYVFAASLSGRVYAIQEKSGLEIWQFPTESSISEPIITIDGRLYVITENFQMFRLDPLTGQQLWYTPGVAKFLSASASRIYVLDPQGRINVLDAAGGARLTIVPGTGGYDVPTVNVTTDRVYLCNQDGLLQCLREMKEKPELAKPVYHARGYAIAPPKKPGEAAPPADGTAPADGAAPTAVDPANPFGT